MTTLGSTKEKFTRIYIRVNPNPILGPDTNNLSNIPGVDDPDTENNIKNLYTMAPIQHNEVGDTAHLYFDISAISHDVTQAYRASFTAYEAVQNLLNYAPYKSKQSLFDLSSIKGIDPVRATQFDTDATIWFNLKDLQPIDVARSKRRVKVLFQPLYNRRSVTALTADAPLAVETVGGGATVSFDIQSLPEA